MKTQPGSQMDVLDEKELVARLRAAADRLAIHKLNSCTCEGLRGFGQHDPNCLAGAIDDACRILRTTTPADFAALEQSSVEVGWQKMGTAPRDGTRFLARFEHRNYAIAAPEDKHQWEEVCIAYWTDFNNGGFVWHGLAGTPTDWCPLILPLPPGEPT